MLKRMTGVLLGLAIVAVTCVPSEAAQLGVGLHYLRTLDEFESVESVSQDDFSLFGTVGFPLAMLKLEGYVEWVPDYLGSEENLIQPAVFGLVPLGPIYGGVGIGIGYLTGDLSGWASNPFYSLRAGMDFGLGGLALDVFASYRFQSASFIDGASNADLDALTLAAQVKFGS